MARRLRSNIPLPKQNWKTRISDLYDYDKLTKGIEKDAKTYANKMLRAVRAAFVEMVTEELSWHEWAGSTSRGAKGWRPSSARVSASTSSGYISTGRIFFAQENNIGRSKGLEFGFGDLALMKSLKARSGDNLVDLVDYGRKSTTVTLPEGSPARFRVSKRSYQVTNSKGKKEVKRPGDWMSVSKYTIPATPAHRFHERMRAVIEDFTGKAFIEPTNRAVGDRIRQAASGPIITDLKGAAKAFNKFSRKFNR